MLKTNEAAIGKDQEIVGLTVLIFRSLYITMYFAGIKFPKEESVVTQVITFSGFGKQTPKMSS